MNTVIEAKGKCLCGAVELSAKEMSLNVGACHCSMCRKWTGGPLLAVDCQSSVEISGEEHLIIYSSSDWAERGFCSKCGSHLFYKLKEKGQYIVLAGLFDNVENFNFDHQIFIEEKPEYYAFHNNTKNMTGAEVFEMFGS